MREKSYFREFDNSDRIPASGIVNSMQCCKPTARRTHPHQTTVLRSGQSGLRSSHAIAQIAKFWLAADQLNRYHTNHTPSPAEWPRLWRRPCNAFRYTSHSHSTTARRTCIFCPRRFVYRHATAKNSAPASVFVSQAWHGGIIPIRND